EHPLAPLLVLADEIAARVDGTPGTVVLRLPATSQARRHPAGPPATEGLAPHAGGVDLVDEDDALAAPFARELLRLAREEADDDRVDADKGCREARAGDRDERRVEAGGDRLREHRLAGTRRAVEEQAALALAAGALEHLARLPQRDDAAHFLLGFGLPADVVEPDAPFGVAGLVAADLRDAHQEQRAHEDEEVREEEEADDDDLHPEGLARAELADRVEDAAGGAPPGDARAVGGLQPLDHEQERDDDEEPLGHPQVEAPGPRAAAVD